MKEDAAIEEGLNKGAIEPEIQQYFNKYKGLGKTRQRGFKAFKKNKRVKIDETKNEVV